MLRRTAPSSSVRAERWGLPNLGARRPAREQAPGLQTVLCVHSGSRKVWGALDSGLEVRGALAEARFCR